jgi:ribokinase
MSRYIVCLGAINLNLLYKVHDLNGFLAAWNTGLVRGEEEAVSPDGEKRLLELLPRFSDPLGRFGGGPAANAAYALARLDIPVVLVGRVGADEEGAFLKASLSGVNLDYLVTQGQSGRAYILLDSEGDRTILVAPHTNDRLKEQDIPLEVLAGSAFVHVSCAGADSQEAERRILLRLAGSARVCFHPGGLWARRGREALADILDQTETLLVTEKEWQMLGGDLKRHPDWAPPVVLVNLGGARGSRMLTPVRYLDFPPYVPNRVVDTVGASEVFAAGYIAGLFQGLNLPQAVRLASSLAAYALEGSGREQYPDRRVMEAVVASLR